MMNGQQSMIKEEVSTRELLPSQGVLRPKNSTESLLTLSAKRLIKDKLALLGLTIIIIIIAIAILAPLFAPNNPTQVKLEHKLESSGINYPLGTDNLGRCILSRIIYGARISLTATAAVMFLVMTISIAVGTLSGFVGGRLDGFIMRVVDVLLAFPALILALAITGILGPSLTNLMIAIVAVWWAGYARVIRGVVLSLKQETYVLAAKACGTPSYKIIMRHILPGAISPILILATLDMGHIILAISGFSFLGLGAQPPTPEWGVMLNDGRAFMQTAPNLMVFPGLAIMLTVLAFNLIGDGLRDALDPKGIPRA